MPELDQQGSANEVGTFAEAFKVSTRREVTVDVYVRYHGTAPPVDSNDDFDRRVADSLRRTADRTVLI